MKPHRTLLYVLLLYRIPRWFDITCNTSRFFVMWGSDWTMILSAIDHPDYCLTTLLPMDRRSARWKRKSSAMKLGAAGPTYISMIRGSPGRMDEKSASRRREKSKIWYRIEKWVRLRDAEQSQAKVRILQLQVACIPPRKNHNIEVGRRAVAEIWDEKGAGVSGITNIERRCWIFQVWR